MNQPDFCDEDGARRLGAKIQAYWAARGRVVRIVYEAQGFIPKMRSGRVDVRSNMVDGWPPKATPILSRRPMTTDERVQSSNALALTQVLSR